LGVKGASADAAVSHQICMVSAGTMSAFTRSGTAVMNNVFLFWEEHSHFIN